MLCVWSSVTAEDNDANDVMVGDRRSLTACTVILSVHGLGVLPATVVVLVLQTKIPVCRRR